MEKIGKNYIDYEMILFFLLCPNLSSAVGHGGRHTAPPTPSMALIVLNTEINTEQSKTLAKDWLHI